VILLVYSSRAAVLDSIADLSELLIFLIVLPCSRLLVKSSACLSVWMERGDRGFTPCLRSWLLLIFLPSIPSFFLFFLTAFASCSPPISRQGVRPGPYNAPQYFRTCLFFRGSLTVSFLSPPFWKTSPLCSSFRGPEPFALKMVVICQLHPMCIEIMGKKCFLHFSPPRLATEASLTILSTSSYFRLSHRMPYL